MNAHDLSTAVAGSDVRWSVRLLGSIEAVGPTGRIVHWPSRAVAALLARLALTPERAHAREELVELLWPGVALDVGRNRLRQALSKLKSMLEEGGAPVISADRSTVRLVRGMLDSDAARFERLARCGALAAARAAYAGELMPGHYDEWVLEARAQLAALHERIHHALERLPVAAADPLPAAWTRVFGIEQPLARLEALLQAERLVTLTGPGGCGKTRLALEAARALGGRATTHAQARRFARIVFVPLAECRDATEATAALALRLHLSGRDPLSDLPLLLGDAPALLVLDNVEQLLPELRLLLQRLLRDCAGLHLLLTSRVPCGLPGEQVLPSNGLPVPAAQAPAATLIENPAVALFIDRARATRPGLGTDDATLNAVAALTRLLDGLPLALELAASRCASFTPEQLYGLLAQAQRESRSLPLLTRPGSTLGDNDRHASIEAVLDWSWRLLDDATKSTLAVAAVFSGHAGLAGVAAMLGENPARVAPRIDTLVAHSLLQRTTPIDAAGPARFTLAQPVREFLGRRVEATAWADYRRALLPWLLDWARALAPSEPMAVVKQEWLTALERLAAVDADPAQRLALLMTLRPWIESGGLPALIQDGLADALEQAERDPAVPTSEAHELLAYLRFEAGLVAQARAHADAALQHAGADPRRRARALIRRVWVDLAAGHGNDSNLDVAAEQTQRLAEALGLALGAGDVEGEARALHQQAVVETRSRADWSRAESLLARSQALWLRLGDRRKAFARLRNRGQCWVHLGRSADARACFEQCAQVADEDGDVIGRIDSLLSLSSLLAVQRQWAAALAADRDCLRLAWRHWHRHGLAYALWNPPLALARLGKPEEAQMLMAFTAGLWEGSFGPLAQSDRRMVQRVRRLVRVQVGAARAEVLWLEGAAMNVARAVECALHVCATLLDGGAAQAAAVTAPT